MTARSSPSWKTPGQRRARVARRTRPASSRRSVRSSSSSFPPNRFRRWPAIRCNSNSRRSACSCPNTSAHAGAVGLSPRCSPSQRRPRELKFDILFADARRAPAAKADRGRPRAWWPPRKSFAPADCSWNRLAFISDELRAARTGLAGGAGRETPRRQIARNRPPPPTSPGIRRSPSINPS